MEYYKINSQSFHLQSKMTTGWMRNKLRYISRTRYPFSSNNPERDVTHMYYNYNRHMSNTSHNFHSHN